MQKENRMIYADEAIKNFCGMCNAEFAEEHCEPKYCWVYGCIDRCNTVDSVEIKTIEAWLYEIALNNVGVKFDGDFSKACEVIISRLDGLRTFARERIEDV